MPTNRTRTKRNRKSSIVLDESIIKYLLFEEKPERGTPAWALYSDDFFDGAHLSMEAWQQHREALMEEWKKTKRRGLPWAAKFDEEEK